MGPDKIVFAGRIILEAILHRLKEWREGPGGTQAAMCKQNACMMGFEKFYINYVIEASVVDGAMFLQASLHTDSRGGGLEGAAAFANTLAVSWVLQRFTWALSLPTGCLY